MANNEVNKIDIPLLSKKKPGLMPGLIFGAYSW